MIKFDDSHEMMSERNEKKENTVELRCLEHLWNHGNLFDIWVVRAIEG